MLRPSPDPSAAASAAGAAAAVAAARSWGRPAPWLAPRASEALWYCFSTPAGVRPSEEQDSASRPSPFVLLQSGRLSASGRSARPASCPAPPRAVLRAPRCGGRGQAQLPRPSTRGPAVFGSRRLFSPLVPRRRRRRRRPASSPEAKWRRLEGGRAAAGVRCVPSRLLGSALGDWVCSQSAPGREGRDVGSFARK